MSPGPQPQPKPLARPAPSPPPEGWCLPTSTARRFHYFRNRRSLCGRYGYTGIGQGELTHPKPTGDPDFVAGPEDCAGCATKLRKRYLGGITS